ncbi:rCG37150 [Rattus norvegicus]|uniref:RCG37150 n=1 Tax=Rattus norvegicus TaxID=10116 RepID=A6HU65_RAT|nr:rCG37150 [Rattus norvegicus]
MFLICLDVLRVRCSFLLILLTKNMHKLLYIIYNVWCSMTLVEKA